MLRGEWSKLAFRVVVVVNVQPNYCLNQAVHIRLPGFRRNCRWGKGLSI
jgi:hypothetical protein